MDVTRASKGRLKRTNIVADASTGNNEIKSKYFKADGQQTGHGSTTKPPATDQQLPLASGNNSRSQLSDAFFKAPCKNLAVALLGKKLVRKVGNQRISGKIVETEAYLGLEDKAAHSYQGKRTEKTEAMFMKPGTAYVYNIYGMYCCFNISSEGDGCAVLVRSLEPEEGVPLMQASRQKSAKQLKVKDLTNGPSKLCQALQINKQSCNKLDLTSSDQLWLEEGEPVSDSDVVKCPRINIGYAQEWEDKPLRFYIRDNMCVSVKYKG